MKHQFLLLASFLFFACMAQGQIISTIAGDSLGGRYTGDNIPATNASLNRPYSTAVDNKGNVYIADYGNNRIRKINTAGVITTVAGTGVAGFSGDDSAATAAKLCAPVGVALDKIGNLYISEVQNERIRKVDTTGIITTYAGTGGWGYNGDNIPATNAELNSPQGIAIDNDGNLYICDVLNERIRKVSTDGLISTIAGNGTAGYSGDGNAATNAELDQPYGIAADGVGNIYFCEWSNNCVRKINTLGIINTIAGTGSIGFSGDGGPATEAKLNTPTGIDVDGLGNVYTAEGNARVRVISPAGIINTYAGKGINGYAGDGGLADSAEISGPTGVSIDINGNIYIADYGNSRIRCVKNILNVNEMNKKISNISIYPNPSKGIFYVKLLSDINAIVPISIKDVLGNKVLEVDLFTNQILTIKIDVPAGVYFLSATYFGERWYDKIIVN